MTCESKIEKLVECARRRAEPGAALQAHLNVCEQCSDRWQAERNLTSQLRIVRIGASIQRSPEHRREALMQRFSAQRQSAPNRRWLWTLATAAVALLSVLIIPEVNRRLRPLPGPQSAVVSVTAESEIAEDGFVAVPYTPPLATGELVSMVHTELYPAALANLGVNVDPAWNTRLPADLLIGEDGFPRAIRVSADYSNDQVF